MDDVAGAELAASVGGLHDQPARRVDARRPGPRARCRRAGRPAPAGRPSRRPRRTTPPAAARPRRRRPARRRRSSRIAASTSSSTSVRSGGSAGPARARATWPSAPAAPRRSSRCSGPTPTTAAGPSGVSTRSTRMPATLRSPIEHVVGPLHAGVDPRARRAPRRRRTRSAAAATARLRWARVGRSSTENVSAAPAGVSQVRSSRPRPAVWCSATTTSPSGAPCRARSATSALVDGASVDAPRRPGRAASSAAIEPCRGVGGGRAGRSRALPCRSRREEATPVSAEGTEVPDDIDIHTTAGKVADLERRLDEAVHAGLGEGGREAARQGQQDRPRADRRAARRGLVRRARRAGPAPLDGLRPGETGAVRRRRGHRLRHHRRPSGVRVLPGLHHLRRLAGRGLRREDHQGDGPRHQDRLPDHRHQRGRRRAHPGGRRLARPLRRDLPPQRARLRRHPADLADHGQLRGRPRLLPRGHRLHGHGRPDLGHVHHRSRRDQDGHRRGRHDGGPRRRAHAQHQVRQRPLHGHGRGRRDRVRQGAALLPAAEQPRRAVRVRRGGRPRAHRPRPGARHADPGLPQPALRHARRDHRGARRRGVPRGAAAVRAQHHRRLRPRRGPAGRRRRQPADAVRRHPRHRRVREGRPVRAHLRRLQHPGADLRRRPRLPARHRPGVERHHPPRRQADLRLRRGDRPAGHRDHPQGLRRRLRRDGLQAPRRRHQRRLADRVRSR